MSALAGAGIAFLGGGIMLGLFSRTALPDLPWVADIAPWSATLILTGLIGIPLSFLALTLDDSARHKIGRPVDAPSLRATFQEIAKYRKIFVLLGIYSISNAMLANSNALWTAPMAVARFNYPISEIGAGIGLQLLTLGPIGLFAAGYFIDKLDIKSGRGTETVALVVSAALLIADIMTPLAPTVMQFWLWQTLMMLASATYIVVTANVVSKLLPANMTGRAIAFLLLLQGLIGVGLAPTLTALSIEKVFAGADQPIAMSMVTMNAIFGSIAFIAAISLYKCSLPKWRTQQSALQD